jgi:hypothetical protein
MKELKKNRGKGKPQMTQRKKHLQRPRRLEKYCDRRDFFFLFFTMAFSLSDSWWLWEPLDLILKNPEHIQLC